MILRDLMPLEISKLACLLNLRDNLRPSHQFLSNLAILWFAGSEKDVEPDQFAYGAHLSLIRLSHVL